jgi:hypothetical protein
MRSRGPRAGRTDDPEAVSRQQNSSASGMVYKVVPGRHGIGVREVMATVAHPHGPFVRRADASRSAQRPILPVLSALTVRNWLGLAVLAVGLVWTVAWNPTLSWYGFTPVGLYHSFDQPPILVALVGLRFAVRARGARARASGSEPGERD